MNGIGCVLNELEQLAIGITAGKDLNFRFKMLIRIARLRFIGTQPSATFIIYKIGKLRWSRLLGQFGG